MRLRLLMRRLGGARVVQGSTWVVAKTDAELKLDFKVALKAKALLKATAALLWMVAVKPKKAKPELRVAVRELWKKKLRLKTHV